ncbi:MAG: energy-coupling factor ABC transporter ATP-binding protein [Anaeromicrobium sp.]|jgi:cobalt/nickel transport system ATP-binding protein|uniref:energy-coupling factor ABC transporter ATP-binding protein n=1 Tax=Anaeromicrobium sp. TaxID=1929132 RepID=UPI0025CEAF61|nr:ABC transporter ATP-binding protein [Anaeromicrobium sp.]MCT4595114.1 energy-coupling factor ABC transporter ATP-binding protein [Anaeromicrobium sp.]
MIKIDNVTFKYREKIALNNIKVNIKEGESVAIIGPNGSGKSTFLKLLNGIVIPHEGTYMFDGTNITEKRLQENGFSKLFHKRIGFVFQNADTQLFCSSVFEEIAFGPMQMGLPKDEINERVNDCLSMLSIEKSRDEHPYNLSGGEKKRVAIASVLSMNPEVITLDEPMNGIDPKGKRFLRELFIKLNKAGKTIICATHDFEYVEGLFKRALVFSENHTIIRDDEYNKVVKDEEFLIDNNIK